MMWTFWTPLYKSDLAIGQMYMMGMIQERFILNAVYPECNINKHTAHRKKERDRERM